MHLLDRLRRSQVRVRLTLLYGGLFTIAGAALLAITYLLVRNSPHANNFVTYTSGAGGQPGPSAPPRNVDRAALLAQADRQHAAELHQLLVQSGIALAIMTVLSIGLGWLVAGRILRPLRTITASIQRISARNVHERLAAGGPRDELRDLSDTVDGLLQRLDTALDGHKRFVANAAHELRTPLTLEHALLEETLIDREADLDSFRFVFQRLLSIGGQQARLLESLLTLAEGERGPAEMEPVDLAATAHHVLLARRSEVDRRGLRVETAFEAAGTHGDPALMERLVANLVDNAIDHNVPGGFIRISTGTSDQCAVVSVANSGPLVPAEQVDRLFEPFQRLDRTADRDGHHGLGLSIVKAIASAHNAVIAARARPDSGLAVTVTFPPR